MKPQIKTKLLKALRSGDYEQGVSQLRRGDKFCCLGILCDLYSKSSGVNWTNTGLSDKYSIHENQDTLPKPVMKWSGIDSASGAFINSENMRSSLTGLNDRGSTFEEIADIIEEHF